MLNNKVRQILENNYKARNSDQELVIQVWEKYGLYLTGEQRAKLLEIPSSDTITRCRRKIQENGEFPADESVKMHRKIKSMIIEQAIPKTKEVDKLFDDADYQVKKYWV
jgi:hypothetical protein